MLVTDSVTLGEPRRTKDGYLVVDAKVARTGIQVYSGREAGRPELDRVRMYRPEEEVFHQDALASFTHRPVTRGHPSRMVDAKNWKEHAVGMTGDSVVRDGHFMRLPFTLMDQATIDAVDDGERELSNGYICQIDWTPGTTPEGEAYDAVQRNIRGNHLAVVPRGRAGSECRIGDSWGDFAPQHKEPSMPDALRTVLVDGISISTTDQGAQVIERLQNKLELADVALKSANDEHARTLQAKDGVIGALKATHSTDLQTKDGEIAALKAQVLDEAALDARAEARSILIDQAKKTLGATFDAKGKSDVAIQREVVRKALGDSAKDMSDAEIGGAFKVVAAKPAVDPLRRALGDLKAPVLDGQEGVTAHNEMVNRITNAWQKPAAQGAR